MDLATHMHVHLKNFPDQTVLLVAEDNLYDNHVSRLKHKTVN